MHQSVLLEETLEYLNLKETSIIVDCTLGYGGHSSQILKKIKRGFLFAFDQDDDAIKASEIKLKEISNNYEIIKSNFVYLKEELNKRNVTEVDGILFDLGVSSPQLDEGERGFSFHQDARLDMRMDKNNPVSAYEVVNTFPYEKLVDIFFRYGEEKYAKEIAKKIVKVREEKPIETTLELVEIIKSSVPEKYKREKHPARKVFQAIRIEVNQELEVFESALNQALDLIKVGGRVCVITFHSLEDRICKQIFKERTDVDKVLKDLPVIPAEYQPKYKIIGSFNPSAEELKINNRARSAKLRVIEKIRE
jgi:16S rRNA (cytosine1402-N4)-methyltransferase